MCMCMCMCVCVYIYIYIFIDIYTYVTHIFVFPGQVYRPVHLPPAPAERAEREDEGAHSILFSI